MTLANLLQWSVTATLAYFVCRYAFGGRIFKLINTTIIDRSERQSELSLADRRSFQQQIEMYACKLAELTERLRSEIEGRKRATAERESEQALWDQTRILKSILDSMGDAVVVADENGKVVLLNPAAEQVLDLNSAGLGESGPIQCQLNLSDMTTPYPASDQPINRAIRGEVFDAIEAVVPRHGGKPDVWVSATGRPIKGENGVLKGGVVVFHDITERKRSEALLHESESRFRQLAERIDDVFWMYDPAAGRVLYISPAFERKWGLSSQSGYDDPESILDLVHPDDRLRVLSALERQISGSSTSEEIQITLPNGGNRWIWNRGFPILDESGKVRRVVGLAEDITDRRNTEEVNARLAAIVESSECAIIGKTLDGVITSWNSGAERIFGYKREEIIGQRSSILTPADRADEESSILEKLRHGEHMDQFRTIRIVRGGRHLEVAITMSQIKDSEGTVIGASEIIRDMTDLRRAEDALRDTAAQLRSIIDNAVDGIINIDENGIIESLNPAALRIFGYSREELQGRNVNILMPEPYHGEHDMYLSNYRRTGNREIIGIGREVMGKRKDGTTFAVDLGVSEVKLANRRIFTGIVRDITHRKEAERALVAAKDGAEAGSRAKSEFLANMSHEIRTPLTAIIGFADMMMEREQSAADRLDFLQVIRRNCHHLLGLINNILDLSKIEAEQMTTEQIACDLPQLLADVASMIRPWASEKGLEFAVTFDGPIPRLIKTDPIRLRQILVNLIGNAIKFTSTGRISVRTRCDMNGPSMILRFCVRDTGMGMSKEQVARLFQPFTQADESTTRRFGGTGLGLTISRRLTRLLGGDIEIQSELGVGSSFTAWVDGGSSADAKMLDNLTEATLPSAGCSAVARDIFIRGRILLAEDGRDNQRLLTTQLHAAGADVTVAENGQIAVDLAMSQPFDLVLMDMQMPEMDGYIATAELRRRGFKLPIVALTAHAMADDRRKCLASGCTDYLTKPVEMETLLRTVSAHLGQHMPQSATDDTKPPEPQASDDSSGPLKSSMAHHPRMKQIIGEFVEGLPAEIKKMRELLDHKDLDSLRRVVHQLRGTGGGYGFDRVTELAAGAEDSIRAADNLKSITEQINSLIEVIQRIEGFEEIEGKVAAPGGLP